MSLLNKLNALGLIVPIKSANKDYEQINLSCKDNLLVMSGSDGTNEITTSYRVECDRNFKDVSINHKNLLTIIKALNKQKLVEDIVWSYDEKSDRLVLQIKDGQFELITTDVYESPSQNIDLEYQEKGITLHQTQIEALFDAVKHVATTKYYQNSILTFVNLDITGNTCKVTSSNGHVYYSVNTQISDNNLGKHDISLNIPATVIKMLSKLEGLEVIDIILNFDDDGGLESIIFDTGYTEILFATDDKTFPKLNIGSIYKTWGTYNRKQLIKDIERSVNKRDKKQNIITLTNNNIVSSIGKIEHQISNAKSKGNIDIGYKQLVNILKSLDSKDILIEYNSDKEIIKIDNFIIACKAINLDAIEAVEVTEQLTGQSFELCIPIACTIVEPTDDYQYTDFSSIEIKQDNQDIETIETTMNTQIEATQAINKTTQFVSGVGDIELLPVDSLVSGMYLYFNDLIYLVSSVKKVDFINSKASYIVTVTTLLNAVDTQQILLTGNELLPAWKTQFTSQKIEDTEAIEQSTEDSKFKRKIAKKASELVSTNKVAKREIKPISEADYSNTDIPKPTLPVKDINAGIKGSDREKLLKMVAVGCTHQDMMQAFNWSKKNAQNHTTYIKWWGYDLVRQGKLYKLA